MLILNRQRGRAVLFTGDIRVVIVGCSKRGAIIGIEAPDNVVVMREEIAIETSSGRTSRQTARDLTGSKLAVGAAHDGTQETGGAAEDGLPEKTHAKQERSSGSRCCPAADTRADGPN